MGTITEGFLSPQGLLKRPCAGYSGTEALIRQGRLRQALPGQIQLIYKCAG